MPNQALVQSIKVKCLHGFEDTFDASYAIPKLQTIQSFSLVIKDCKRKRDVSLGSNTKK